MLNPGALRAQRHPSPDIQPDYLCCLLYSSALQARPPFAIKALSAPIPLVYGKHPRIPAWGHIAFPMSLQLLEETNQLMIGYGSGDQVPRVKLMDLQDALALFEQTGGQQQQQQGRETDKAGAAGGVLD